MMQALLLIALAFQETPEELEELLQQFQAALEAEAIGSASERAARAVAAAGAASRMDTPQGRRALWQALADADEDPGTRLAVVEALSRMGDLQDVSRMLSALTQIRSTGRADAGRVEAAESRLRSVHRATTTVARTDAPVRRSAAPVPRPKEEETSKRNWVLGGAGLLLAALLLLLRKGRS